MSEHSKENQIVPDQLATYVYLNAEDAVVISQETNDPQDDRFVYIHRAHLHVLIEKLKTYLPEGGA